MFWDGRATTLEEQALGPIQAPGKMGMDLPTLLTRLNAVPEYRTRFTAAYGAGDITTENIGKAIAAYERTIISANSAFDRYVKGNELALEAKRGMALFVGMANCIVSLRSLRF